VVPAPALAVEVLPVAELRGRSRAARVTEPGGEGFLAQVEAVLTESQNKQVGP
jgi:hypothetical protein